MLWAQKYRKDFKRTSLGAKRGGGGEHCRWHDEKPKVVGKWDLCLGTKTYLSFCKCLAYVREVIENKARKYRLFPHCRGLWMVKLNSLNLISTIKLLNIIRIIF